MSNQLDSVPAVFNMKVSLAPKEMNAVGGISSTDDPLTPVLEKSIKSRLEQRCSTHGWVVPDSVRILSRTMGHLENGRYTGNIIFHVQLEAEVLNPASGDLVAAEIVTNNEMGIMAIYKHTVEQSAYEAMKILIPLVQVADESDDEYRARADTLRRLEKGSAILIRIEKSRFQINDEHILSVGEYVPSAPAEAS